ncbi:MAG: hypothetical protein HY785_05465 [Oscillatoriophycideae cyanobacterium NC_groundwater_1537_Pr4_S-0.65um_50_18]|nr:hypothetical protein [Oscillatoriophycideae cyanobacterium NC_groundwater_1537_Pr4_S-0.65um_50_18]
MSKHLQNKHTIPVRSLMGNQQNTRFRGASSRWGSLQMLREWEVGMMRSLLFAPSLSHSLITQNICSSNDEMHSASVSIHHFVSANFFVA